MSDPTALVPRGQPLPAASGEAFTLAPKSLAEAMEYAKLIASSNLCPVAFRGKPADVLIAVQIGAELGVSPLQALANVAVINGRACLWGDLVVGLVQRSGRLEYLREEWDETAQVATVRIKRIGKPERVERFSMADAKRAKLAGKDTYQQYPQRMCGWRAKTFAIRAEFADVLKGLSVAEEVMDLPAEAVRDVEPPAPIRQPQMTPAPAEQSAPEPQPAAPSQAPEVVEGLSAEEILAAAEPPEATAPEGSAAGDPRHEPEAASESPAASAPLTVISASVAKRGHRDGRPWTLYRVTFSDGREAGTFSDSVYALAQRAAVDGLEVRVATSPDPKTGRLRLDALELADA